MQGLYVWVDKLYYLSIRLVYMQVCCFGLNGVRYIKVLIVDFKCDLNWIEFFV